LKVIVEADGGSRGNPGPAAYGALVRDPATGEVIAQDGKTLGTATNNFAEYSGLIAGLELAAEYAPNASIEVRMDSKLVVEQMAGRWKIKHPDLQALAIKAQGLAPFGTEWTWVPRAQNAAADALANMALDGVPQELIIYDDGYEAGPGTWAEMELPISRNATRTIDISYQFRGDALASAEFARAQLGIHAQTYWGNNVVPRIEARLALRGSGFTVADFEPRDAVSGPCVADLQREGQTLVWKVRSYRRSTWNRSTTDWLVRPPGTPPAVATDPDTPAAPPSPQ
jgi:ribonuclease HI